MAVGGSTQQSIRKALGALKDSTTVGLAKVNSYYKELDVAIVKATNHVEQFSKEKHIHTIFDAVAASRPRADVTYCINALAKRLARTHNWADRRVACSAVVLSLYAPEPNVALKTLIVIHRGLREVDPTFHEELINYSRTRGSMLNLSHFKDDSSPTAWDNSAWVRTYALFLEERLECFRVLKYDVVTEYSRTAEIDTIDLLEQLPALQQLLFRLLSCQPEQTIMYNNVIRHALSIVARESIKIYSAINAGILNLVEKFFEMQRHDALRALEIYRKAGHQAERLSEFYEMCKVLNLGRMEDFVIIEQPPASFVAAMEEYVKDIPHALSSNQIVVESVGQITPRAILAIEKVNDDPENIEPALAPQPTSPVRLVTETIEASVQALDQPPVTDLLCLDFNQGATEMEEKNALAFDIVAHDNPVNDIQMPNPITGSTGWELELVGASSSNQSALAESKLAGGLDKLTLDSLYDDAIARRTDHHMGYHMSQVAPNPFEVVQYSQDPFSASNSIAPPSSVQMATMAQQQALMMQQQQQQQAMGQGTTNPFGNPYNPYTGYT